MADNHNIDSEILNILRKYNASIRLIHGIQYGYVCCNIPFTTPHEFLCNSEAAKNILLSLPNIGKKCANEFFSIMEQETSRFQSMTKSVPSNIREIESTNDSEELNYPQQPQNFVKELVNSITDKERLVFCKRYGLFGHGSQTLEQIGITMNVTRERIRQIEKKALNKLRNRYDWYESEKIIENFRPHIIDHIFNKTDYLSLSRLYNVQQTLPKWLTALIHISASSLREFMDHYFYPSTVHDGWYKSESHRIENLSHPDLNQIIIDKLNLGNSEIDIGEIVKITNSNREVVVDHVLTNDNIFYLKSRRGNDFVSLKKISLKGKVRNILKDAGTALTIHQIKNMYENRYSDKKSIGQIGNILRSMEVALIVDRGTYNLYANLAISKEQLYEVRDATEKHLIKRGVYVSSKIIIKSIKKLLLFSDATWMDLINGYVLLGILQDDDRFICNRGFMIGLKNTKIFKGVFKPLQVEIIELFKKEKRALSILEIIELLSDTRELIVPSLLNFLEQQQTYENIGSAKYILKSTNISYDYLDKNLSEEALFNDW